MFLLWIAFARFWCLLFVGDSGERSLFPSSGEGCPVGAGWFGGHTKPPRQAAPDTPPKEGNGPRPSPTGGDLCCSPACGGGMTRLLEMRHKEIAPCLFRGKGR